MVEQQWTLNARRWSLKKKKLLLQQWTLDARRYSPQKKNSSYTKSQWTPDARRWSPKKKNFVNSADVRRQTVRSREKEFWTNSYKNKNLVVLNKVKKQTSSVKQNLKKLNHGRNTRKSDQLKNRLRSTWTALGLRENFQIGEKQGGSCSSNTSDPLTHQT